MNKLFYDTETCGLHGLCVLIQYQYNDDPVQLFSPWTEQVIETLKLIEWMMEQNVVGFNLAFDHFHLSKLHTIWSLLDPHAYPEDIINDVAEIEPKGRDGFCIKPKAACDLMLHCRKGKYQDTMQRKDIKIKRIHISVAWDVRDYLEANVKLDDIYFARAKNKYAPRWGVFDTKDPEWKDIKLRFKPSGALKVLAIHALGYKPEEILQFGDLEGPTPPVEVGYAPFATALSSPEREWKTKIKKASGWKRGHVWPALISEHINHWLANRFARKYAEDDVKYTKELYYHLGEPEIGDDDSELACMVGANRWRGYAIDRPKLEKLKITVEEEARAAPKAPNAVHSWLVDAMTEEECAIFELLGSTKKTILEELANTWEGEVSKRAKLCLKARQSKYRLDMINKLLLADRFHVSADVIGTLSGRKSGSGGDLNSQGIGGETIIRECFPLALKGMILCGGDFESFEVTLAITVYGDEKMAEVIRSGRKIHAIFGTHAYPYMTYEEVLNNKEKYRRSKSALFALIYFGEAFTLKTRLGITIEDAEECYDSFMKDYEATAKGRQKVVKMFQSMRQPKGIDTKVYWNDPANKIETIFGFPRFFTLENQICKALFNLAENPPTAWNQFRGKVIRRDREQSISGAVKSALYAAAFAIQGSNTRAGGNHVIQGSGAQITKHLERKLWDLQPCGIHPWIIQPFNEHDEIMAPCVPEIIDEVNNVVTNVLDEFRSKVPLIAIDWHNNMNSWAEK